MFLVGALRQAGRTPEEVEFLLIARGEEAHHDVIARILPECCARLGDGAIDAGETAVKDREGASVETRTAIAQCTREIGSRGIVVGEDLVE